MTTPNEREYAMADSILDGLADSEWVICSANTVSLARDLASYREEIEAAARAEVERLRERDLLFHHALVQCREQRMWPDSVRGIVDAALAPSAVLARESAEPAALLGKIRAALANIDQTKREEDDWWDGYASALEDTLKDAEPAEERGPEVGDVVYIHWRNDHREVTTYSALLQAEVRGATVVVLLRRAEVEARIKKEEGR